MSKKAPKPPDPMKTAAAQTQMNRDTAITQQQLNMVGQSGPFGNVSYTQTGTWADGTPRYEQVTSLDPNAQAALDASLQAQSNLAGLASQQASRLQTSLADPFEFTNRDAELWAYDLAAPRILQQQGQNEASLRAILANKGIREGSAAWNAEMARMTNANTDQLNQLALAGRGQAFNEALASRNQPLTELGAILGMGMSGVNAPSQMYGATPQSGVANVDYTGLVQKNYEQQMAGYNSQMNALGGLFKLGLGFL